MTLLYTDVFSPNSKTWQFEKAVSRVKEDPRCISLLGSSKDIKAYGEPTGNRWTRNRPIAYVHLFGECQGQTRLTTRLRTTIQKDSQGREHMKIKFYVSHAEDRLYILLLNPDTGRRPS